MIVVDTNVVSELMKPEPNVSVRRWTLAQAGTDLYATAITLAEILYGIERLPSGRRKELLRSTATDVFATFADKVLSFDAGAVAHYSQMSISATDSGSRSMASDATPAIDVLGKRVDLQRCDRLISERCQHTPQFVQPVRCAENLAYITELARRAATRRPSPRRCAGGCAPSGWSPRAQCD